MQTDPLRLSVPPTTLLWLLLAALLFYQLKSLESNVLMAIIIMMVVLGGWGYFMIFPTMTQDRKHSESPDGGAPANAEILSSNKMLPLTPVEAQQVPRKGLKYLSKNPHLTAILDDLRFTQMFDKGRYQHLRVLMNQYQKQYVYLLGRRTTIRQGVPIFYDLQDAILEILYSLAVNVPVKLRHTYGLTPHERIHAQTEAFLGLTRTMTEILQNFATIELKEPYFPEWVPRSFSLKQMNSVECKNVLP